MRGLLAGRVPPEGPWELQGIELLSQKELYCQILLLLHLLPQDLLLLQVRPPPAAHWVLRLHPRTEGPACPSPVAAGLAGLRLWAALPSWPEVTQGLCRPSALPVFLLLLSGGAGPSHPVWAPRG